MREKPDFPLVVYRGIARRIEVETEVAMYEFDVTSEGLTPGGIFAQGGHDLGNITPIHRGIALRLASEKLEALRAKKPFK